MSFFKSKNEKKENNKSKESGIKKTTAKKEKDYFETGQDWEASKRIQLLKNLKLTTGVATVFFITTVLLAVAISMMMPLKQIQLEIVRVDSSTGIVEVLEQQKEAKTNYEETVNTYFVKRYIRYREGYSYPLMTDYYKYVGLLSTPTEQQIYAKWFNPSNATSPLILLGQKKTAVIKFKSVTYLSNDVALVRFTKEIRDNENLIATEHLTATVRFTYTTSAISSLDKEINPLGFQVIEYRIDEDSISK